MMGGYKMMNLKKLLNSRTFRQLLSYLMVGGIATVVEWVCFYLFSYRARIHYLPATALAFAVSTAANWLAGRLLTFRGAEKQPILQELAKIYAVSIIGLLLNLLLMYLFVQKAGLAKMTGKIIATILVFAWNFIVRKFWIYRR